MSSLNAAAVLSGIVSVLQKVGSIEQTITGQGQNPPSAGVGAVVWAGPIRPVARRSGLGAVSIALDINVRLTVPMSTQPPESVETTLLGAFSDMCNALAGGFTLGGQVEQVDLLGAYGSGLHGDPGYVPYDGATYRCITAVVPVVLDDVWSDAP
jgi:hypothetical protein